MIEKLDSIKESSEKTSEKKEIDPAGKAGYRSSYGFTSRHGGRKEALSNYFGMDGPKKAKKNRTFGGDIDNIKNTASSISGGVGASIKALTSLVDFIAPELKGDINKQFEATHVTPYKQAESFLMDAAAQGVTYNSAEMDRIYKQFQSVGKRQLEAQRKLQDSPARREGLVAANVKSLIGWDMDEFILKLSRAFQAWWNNDASLKEQKIASVDASIEERAAKYGGVKKMMQTPLGGE